MCSSYGDVILKKHDREKERERERKWLSLFYLCVSI